MIAIEKDVIGTVIAPTTDGISSQQGLSFQVEVRRDAGIKRMYGKYFCPKQSPRGLVNEALGYILAKECGLPVANEALIALADNKTLTRIMPHIDWTGIGYAPIFCSQEINGKTPKAIILEADNFHHLAELAKWQELPEVVAFDDWVANFDRNLGNLILLSSSKKEAPRYAVFDHDQALTGCRWTIKQLSEASGASAESLLTQAAFPDGAPNPTRSAIVDKARNSERAYNDIQQSLKDFLATLGMDDEHISAITDLLVIRAASSEPRLSDTYGLLT